MKTIPKLQQELADRQARALNDIFYAHKDSVDVTLDIPPNVNEQLAKNQKTNLFIQQREAVIAEATDTAKLEFVLAEKLYYQQEAERVAEVVGLVFGPARGMSAPDLHTLLTASPESLDALLSAALSIGNMNSARQILFAAQNRQDEISQRIFNRWREEVDGGPNDLTLLGELEMVRGTTDLEERLREAQERFETVRPSWSPERLTEESLRPTTAR